MTRFICLRITSVLTDDTIGVGSTNGAAWNAPTNGAETRFNISARVTFPSEAAI